MGQGDYRTWRLQEMEIIGHEYYKTEIMGHGDYGIWIL